MADFGSAVADFGWRPVADLEGIVAEIREKTFILRARPHIRERYRGGIGDRGRSMWQILGRKRPKSQKFSRLRRFFWCCGRSGPKSAVADFRLQKKKLYGQDIVQGFGHRVVRDQLLNQPVE